MSIALLVTAAPASVADPFAVAARAAQRYRTPCDPTGQRPVFLLHRERQEVVAASPRVRVFRVLEGPSASAFFACHVGARRKPVNLGSPFYVAARPGRYGWFGLTLGGDYLVAGAVGDGCERAECVGPTAFLVNVRTGRRRELRGAVDFGLSSGGQLLVIVTTQLPENSRGDGSTAGPGPFEVHRISRGRDDVLDAGAAIDPASLAVGQEEVYWVKDGVARAMPIHDTAGGSGRTAMLVGGSQRCGPRGSVPILQTFTGSVWSRRLGADDHEYFACLRSSGRSRRLGVCSPESCISRFQLAGSYLAYVGVSGSSSGVGTGVHIQDLASSFADEAFASGDVTALQASRHGFVVWIQHSSGAGRVRLLNRQRRGTILDQGAIGPRSLALSADGRTAYWTRDGQPQSARLA